MRKVLLWFICFGLYLGLSEGYLALWKEGSSKPEKVFPYHISLYPKNDQDQLEKGIPIGSKEELSKQIEDFLS
jgi:hypothetical protein